jgi:hypothetical protein
MLVKDITERFQIPHEDDQWIEVRQLGFVELQASRRAKEQDALTKARTMGAEFIKGIQDVESIKSEKPGDDYDRESLLVASITAWSYPDAVTPKAISTLDERTATWLFGKIVDLYTVDETDPKDSPSSTAPSNEAE